MSNRVFFADAKDKSAIERLRQQEYAKASGFALDLTTLQWRASDDESFVLAAESDGKLVSTMRGEVIDNYPLLERKLECPWDFPLELDMPVLLLSRASTCSSQRSVGLNLLLRYWFLRLASAYDIRFVIGTFVSGSPRENSLREMGYQFFENALGWQQFTYRSLRPVTVAVLDMATHGDQAFRYCMNRAHQAIEVFPFKDKFPNLRYMRSV